MRVSETDREQVVERLKAAFVEGRLDRHEFGVRVQYALVARTRSDLAPLLTDLEAPAVAPVPRPAAAPVPRPTAGERGWGMLSHMLGSVTSFVGPLVILLTKGRRSPFVRRQSAESVNFQLTYLLAHFLMAFVVGLTLGIGVLLYIPLVLGWMVLMFAGAIASLAGNEFRYPYNIRLVR